MRWLFDTNVFIVAFAGVSDAVRAMKQARDAQAAWIGFSAITRLEVLGYSGLTPADEKGLRELPGQFVEAPVSPFVIDQAIDLRKRIRIKTPDALIAATALVQKAELVTRNATDFRRVPGLNVSDSANL